MKDKMVIEYQKDKDKPESILKEYYARYLIDVRNLKMSSVRHYFDALNNISKRLKEKNLVKRDIYEIGDLRQLLEIREILFRDSEFIELNERGKRMYSAGLNNYCRFASGQEFQKAREKIIFLDIPVEPESAIMLEKNIWKRSGIMRTQAIEFADYSCEIDGKHKSFIAERNKKPYMEGHHAIPMKLQPKFDKSLDVYANIICLCPICHRKIHYGLLENRKQMMGKIYEDRSERLAHCGIKLSKQEFTQLIVKT